MYSIRENVPALQFVLLTVELYSDITVSVLSDFMLL